MDYDEIYFWLRNLAKDKWTKEDGVGEVVNSVVLRSFVANEEDILVEVRLTIQRPIGDMEEVDIEFREPLSNSPC